VGDSLGGSLAVLLLSALFHRHTKKRKCTAKFFINNKTGISSNGQNAAAPVKDRLAFAGRRGQMTHAGLAAMAVAARLGPA
jgi:hypothetical protein